MFWNDHCIHSFLEDNFTRCALFCHEWLEECMYDIIGRSVSCS